METYWKLHRKRGNLAPKCSKHADPYQTRAQSDIKHTLMDPIHRYWSINGLPNREAIFLNDFLNEKQV